MPETNKLGLPLVAAAQAQKHVTVNEALTRLDALVQLSLGSVGGTVPPGAPTEGDAHAVGSGASGAWSGQDGQVALFVNGGWAFLSPQSGWQAWADGTRVQFDGVDWVPGAGALSSHGAGFVHRSLEVDHNLSSGGTSLVAGFLPENSIVYGVTGRVVSSIGGATGLEIGVAGSSDRYGSGISTTVGSWLRGLTGSPLTYYTATDLLLTALGGNFDGTGTLRLAVHYAELTLPRA